VLSDFDVVVAADLKRGIGKGGNLPWHLPGDMRQFREITSKVTDPAKKNAIVMGRKTWESIPAKRRPLPGRINVVITRDKAYQLPEEVVRAASLDDALAKIAELSVERSFVIGGGEIYRLAVDHPACHFIYLTEVKSEFDCETFFPEIEGRFALLSVSDLQEEEGIEYAFKKYGPKSLT